MTRHDPIETLTEAATGFGFRVTPAMSALIDPNDANDPIARQFLPSEAEGRVLDHERHDPIGDDPHSPVKGLVHRYPDRVLLKLVNACPVYCRFCFRREMVGPKRPALSEPQLQAALGYIGDHKEVWEVILTGGDPMIFSSRRIKSLIGQLNLIDHVKIVRLHSRVPVVAPELVTPAMVRALKARKPTYVMLHTNHPRELTEAAIAACGRLVDAGIPMLAQTVLLKGVNDDLTTLEALFRRLVEARVKPHYLHHGDLARGTSHFRTGIGEGQALMAGIRGKVSGLAQPTYVLDIPGGHGKVPIGPGYIEGTDAQGWTVTDPKGCRHRYWDDK